VFLTTTLPDATFGAPYGPQILVTGGIYPYTAWYTGGGLAGFSFDLNGSLVSSQVYQFPGTYQLPVIITDSSVSGQRLSYTFTITIKPGIELSPNLLTGAVFQHYSDTIYVVSGGSAPYTFAVASGTLPPGLQLDGTTGALSGTPTIPGTYLFRIAVADSTGLTGAQDYSLDISGLRLSPIPDSLPTGRVGAAYPSITFGADGGVAPYALTKLSGDLPPGMSLSSDWTLSGTPTLGGPYTIVIAATDQIGDTGAFTYTLNIQDIAPATLSDGYVGTQYVSPFFPLAFSNACTLSLVSGILPTGIAFVPVLTTSPDVPNRFYLMGTPTQAGAFSFTMEARDPGGLPVDRSYTLHVSRPVLTISKTHTGNFSQGQAGVTYSITVGNVGVTTNDAVTVSEVLPAGLTLVSMSGSGWSCSGASCARSDALRGGSSYPPIAVTVNVAPDAGTPLFNSVSVSGGGSVSGSTSDSTTIIANAPILTVGMSHTGNFTQGQNGATYSVTVSNAAGAGQTSGTVTVTETVPSGMTLVSMAGTGWTCPAGGTTCTRNDVLNGGSSYAAITVTVNVASNAGTPLSNSVSVSGGGSATANRSDPTVVNASGGSGTAMAAFIKTDTTTQGTWKSVYGADGEAINGDTTSYPSYAQVSFSGQNPFVWTASTADVRGLQKFAAADRIASVVFLVEHERGCQPDGREHASDGAVLSGLGRRIAGGAGGRAGRGKQRGAG
jgi:uncharacterized repeat protein (TIGR01451 family)